MATDFKAGRTPLESAHANQRSRGSLVTSDVLVEGICKKKRKKKELDMETKSM